MQREKVMIKMFNFFRKQSGFFGKKAILTNNMTDINNQPLADYIVPELLFAKERLIRLGTPYGGWLLPENCRLDENSICYLAGAGEDISFDCALVQEFGCMVRIIDPTPRAIAHFEQFSKAVIENKQFPINGSATDFYNINLNQLERMNFLPFGLAGQDIEQKFYLPKNPEYVSCSTVNLQRSDDYFVAQCYRLKTFMGQQGDKYIDLLKMDIEGGEYLVIEDLVKSSSLPQILLIEFDEIHTPFDDKAASRIKKSIQSLIDANMCCIAIEDCNATFMNISCIKTLKI